MKGLCPYLTYAVVVGFTKAFELEWRRVAAVLRDTFIEVAKRDPNFKFNVDSATLGQWAKLLELGSDLKPGFKQQHGRDLSSLLRAIKNVNTGKGAKHRDETPQMFATKFRALFLGTESVFSALLPRYRQAQSSGS